MCFSHPTKASWTYPQRKKHTRGCEWPPFHHDHDHYILRSRLLIYAGNRPPNLESFCLLEIFVLLPPSSAYLAHGVDYVISFSYIARLLPRRRSLHLPTASAPLRRGNFAVLRGWNCTNIRVSAWSAWDCISGFKTREYPHRCWGTFKISRFWVCEACWT